MRRLAIRSWTSTALSSCKYSDHFQQFDLTVSGMPGKDERMEQLVPFAAMLVAKATRAACQADRYASTVKKVGGKFFIYCIFIIFSNFGIEKFAPKAVVFLINCEVMP